MPHPNLTDWMEAPWAGEDPCDLDETDESSATSFNAKPMVDTMQRPSYNNSENSILMVLCAVDGRGVFAGVAYEWTTSGIAIEELDLEAPACARPVMRGVARVAPGCSLPSAVPIAIQIISGQPVAIASDSRINRLDQNGIEKAQFRIARDPVTRLVTTFE